MTVTMTSPISSTASLPSLTNMSTAASTPGSFSLDRYHEPSTVEKMQGRPGNGVGASAASVGAHPGTAPRVALPPISSFDNLIRAAEKQYALGTHSALQRPVLGAANSGSASMLAFQLSSEAAAAAAAAAAPPPSISNSSSRNSSTGSYSAVEYTLAERTAGQVGRMQPRTATASAGTKVAKPRKKKECPICHNLYANLSTHKSTHLTPENRPHRCPICERGFARNNDLIRHKKRHWREGGATSAPEHVSSSAEEDVETATSPATLKSLHQIKGTFKCPYNSALIKLDMEVYPYKAHALDFETSSCHQTGVFSRCDTFKNHLKALHFEYPPGTKKKDRGIVPGRCKHCGDKFENVDIWLNKHVGKTCGYNYH